MPSPCSSTPSGVSNIAATIPPVRPSSRGTHSASVKNRTHCGTCPVAASQSPARTLPAFATPRWATHGKPTDANAHPHLDASGRLALVHNGVIDNFQILKDRLSAAGTTSSRIPTPKCSPTSSAFIMPEAVPGTNPACCKPCATLSMKSRAPSAWPCSMPTTPASSSARARQPPRRRPLRQR
ncbi:MAG: hypothetical protein HC901_03935 [Bdellovibrionaceae bacterium]|nr:hypothetical protein [Pseudobdellovibrionaceae bacterium]